MSPSGLEVTHHITSILVDCTLLVAAVVAVVKFQIFNVFGHRWRSDLACRHYVLPDGRFVFVAGYTITNTGERPLELRHVMIRLVGSRTENSLLIPDEERVLARRLMQSSSSSVRGLFDIQPGERSIFTLRSCLDHLDDTVFVLCSFELAHRREPAGYRGFYCKQAAPAQPDESSESTPR
jgi:hypothetical protein